MKPPRVGFTVRRLMLSVVAVAVLFAGEATRRRWESLASAYRRKAGECEHVAVMAEHGSGLGAALGNDSEKKKHKRIADHYVALARKYERAATHPWLPVAPDPPEPE
jgi:hypothetical protein